MSCADFNRRQLTLRRITQRQTDFLHDLAIAAGHTGDDLQLLEEGARILQEREQLVVDGCVGPATRRAIDLELRGEQAFGPDLVCLPFLWLPGMAPSDFDEDLADRNAAGKVCPGYDREAAARGQVVASARPFSYGGGFLADRAGSPHHAEDFMCPEGAIVRSPCDGQVLERIVVTVKAKDGTKTRQTRPGCGWSPKGGWHCYIVDRRGWRWYLAHCRDELAVFPGQTVTARQQLGYSGRTGNASRRVRTEDGLALRGCPHIHASLAGPTPAETARFARARGFKFASTKIDVGAVCRELFDAGDWSKP